MLSRLALSALILVTVARTLASAQTVSFLPPVNTPVTDGSLASEICSQCLAVADFNGDGKPDIAYAFTAFSPFSGVLFGNGDGTFRLGATFPLLLDNVTYVATADINGDGRADIIYSSPALIFPGNGDGTFQTPVTVNACPSVSAVADLNHDGKADLVCGTSVLLSNGDGTFRASVTVDPAEMANVLLVADFNGDGKPDLLLSLFEGLEVAVAPGKGDGTFGPDLPVPAELFSNPVTGDFNGDGRLDLAGLCMRAGLLCTLAGNGDGTFHGPVISSFTGILPGPLAATGDFNRDGKLDLVAGNAVLAGNGDGTFRFPVYFGPVSQKCGAAVVPDIPDYVPCLYSTSPVAVADLNGDGLPDVVAGSRGSSAYTGSVVIAALLNDSPGDGFLTPGVSSATLTDPVATGSIVSAFGNDLAPETATAPSGPLPTTLGGIRVHLKDLSAGDILAPLLYVSPTQINYLMASSDPFTWVSLERVGSPYVPKGVAVPVETIAAGLYSVGNNLAAASALSIPPGGVATSVPVTICSPFGCSANPIDLSGAPVYLSLYGTGFANAVAASSNCTIAGQTLAPTYAGPQLQINGLDQVNMLLPRSLAGAGPVSVSCTFQSASGESSLTNALNITLR